MASYGFNQLDELLHLAFEKWIFRKEVRYDKEARTLKIPFHRDDGIFSINFHMVDSHETKWFDDKDKDKLEEDRLMYINYDEGEGRVEIKHAKSSDVIKVESFLVSITSKDGVTYGCNQVPEMHEYLDGKSFDREEVVYESEKQSLWFPIFPERLRVIDRERPLALVCFHTVTDWDVRDRDPSTVDPRKARPGMADRLYGVGYDERLRAVYLKTNELEAYLKVDTFFTTVANPPKAPL